MSYTLQNQSARYFKAGMPTGSIGPAGWGMGLFLFSLPFVFYLQVTFGNARLAAPFYILALMCPIYHFFDGSFRSVRRSTLHEHLLDTYIMYLFVFFLLFALVNFMSGDFGGMQKTLLFFWAPLAVYFWASRCASERELRFAITCIAVSGVIVALNWLYQIYLQTYLGMVSGFQTQARDYLVSGVSDANDTLRISTAVYRAPGLVEIHSHATATVVAVAVMAFASQYIANRKTLYLFIVGALISILFMGSVRLLMIATVVALGYYFAIGSVGRQGTKNALKFILILPLVIGVVIGVYAWRTGTLWDSIVSYYLPFIPGRSGALGEASGIDVMWKLSLVEITRVFDGLRANPLGFFCGIGPTQTLVSEELASEDFFIVHLFAFYGLAGWGAMMLVFGVGVFGVVKMMRDSEAGIRANLCFAACALLVLWISTLHSGVLHRRALWPIFIFALGIIRRYLVLAPSRGGAVARRK